MGTAGIQVRPATAADVPYIDQLMKANRKALGFLSRTALAEYVRRHHVTIGLLNAEPACYLLGRIGPRHAPDGAVIYHACVQYDARHRALGVALVARFLDGLGAAARWVRLWCALDLEANLFWEAVGFTARAWRLGKARVGRVHVLWERPLLLGQGGIQFPLPKATIAGQMQATRDVIPIPAGADYRNVTAEDLSPCPIISVAPSVPRSVPSASRPTPAPKAIALVVGGSIRWRQARGSEAMASVPGVLCHASPPSGRSALPQP